MAHGYRNGRQRDVGARPARVAARASALVGGTLLGLALTGPAASATPSTGPDTPAAPAATASPGPSATAELPIDQPVEAATTPTSATSTTTSSTTSSTTSTTTPPPTTPPVTSGLIPPLVDTGERAQVGDAARLDRVPRSQVRARTREPGATLPLTGDASLAFLASGVGALAIGAGALWWGSRRPPDADPADAPAAPTLSGRPPATG